ncbi:MAG TPA: prolyl oligopeptidase family serine peptidase [Pyrinomonadaceae bacterium]|jgi:prolyl oligopeptidase|nr:prolyl oligopeptidase family serine peptidase [Pyrinomonadaceae bacterium]
MKRSSFEFSLFSFRRAFLPFAIVALALSLFSISLLTPQTHAQKTQKADQKIATAPASDGTSGSPSIVYPETTKGTTVDNYFGVMVADPYRWLEADANQPEVAAWVASENKVTFSYLEKIPFRQKVKDRLTQLYNYPKYSAPARRGDYFFYTKNDGLQNQSVWYRQKGLDGTPEVLLDPNKLSTDGTTRLGSVGISKDGKYLGYGVSKGGSDWNDIYVLDIASKQLQSDHVEWAKFTGVSWQGNGFYYSRYPTPEKGHELTTANKFHQVYYHKVGTQQSEDTMVFEDKTNPVRFHTMDTSDDERFAYLNVSERGSGKKGNALFYRDATKSGDSFTPIVADIGDDNYNVVSNVGEKFLVFTDHKAPNGRVFLFDPQNPDEKNWKDIVPEKPEPLDLVNAVGGKLFVAYLKDVTGRAYVYSLDGKLENEIPMPGPGAVGGFGGTADDNFTFYTFTTFNFPPTIYKYDIATKKSTLFRQPEIAGFKSDDYVTKEIFYTSKDGTRVPMFIVHKKGLKLDGNNPTLLYGYGGFNSNNSPSFSSLKLALLEQGFVYASANMRGGGEYGEKWHEAGTKLQKQNVFDDFIAAAEYLIKEKYTSSSRLAIHGVSNGGLLVGAVSNQRPELFKAVIQQAGVMDMLRFHKFTIGSAWIADYGSSDNAEQFKALYAYSPIHNVKAGASYPATLITTADHDDRVVPAHSFKYAAALQAGQGGDNPILIRIDTKSGHGASSTTKSIEQTADIYSFLMWNLGVTPK